MEMCRACLATGKDMVPMDTNFVNNYNLLTNLNITLTDDMPLYSCKTCFEAVKFCTDFRDKCISSDLTLKEILFPDNKAKYEIQEDNKFNIKQEIKLEYGSDSDSVVLEDYYNDPFECYNTTYRVETKNNEDWIPNKTLQPLKKKVKTTREKEMKVKKHNPICNDDLEHCGICSKKFEMKDDLVKHLEQHKVESCDFCVEKFLDLTHLLAHRVMHVPEKQKKCHICSQRFVSAPYLEFHYIKKHNLRGEGGQLLCKLCLTPYVTPKKLMKHMWAVHSDIKYTCDQCGKGFRLKSALKSHLYKHSNEKTHECDLCDFTSKFATSIREHKIRKHVEGRVYCKGCTRVFRSSQHLDKHICKQAVGIICPICGVTVKKSSHLTRHVRSHTNKYLYKCERCDATYKGRSAYKAHMDKHDGNRSFHCPYCTMSFYSQSVLVKHRRTHTGEKPYVCKICKKGFTGNNNLKVHMKVHGQHLVVKRNTEPAQPIF